MQVAPLEGVTEEKTGLLLSRPKRFFLLVANITTTIIIIFLVVITIICLISTMA